MPADRETALLLRVKEGDRSAFEELFRLYERPLGGYLWRLCGDRALAEDLLQDCFLRIWKAAPSWEPAARVSTWIFRIAHNLHVNEAVRRKDRPEPRPEPSPPPDLEALQRALESLPDGERAVVLLAELQGFKYADVAEILGIPLGTVKSRMFAALRRLREQLGG